MDRDPLASAERWQLFLFLALAFTIYPRNDSRQGNLSPSPLHMWLEAGGEGPQSWSKELEQGAEELGLELEPELELELELENGT